MTEYYDTTDFKSKFIQWYFNEFRSYPVYLKMAGMSEGNSPWHRENTIGIHTDMVVTHYIANAPEVWESNEVLGALACAFHDVGKPRASEKNGIKFKPNRGEYLSFGGHEQISARMTEDWFAKHWTDMSTRFNLRPQDIYSVVWMIEYHLPWGVKKQHKLDAIAQTANNMNIVAPFVQFLMADSYGRLSDDGPDKRAKTTEWCTTFVENTNVVPLAPLYEKDQPVLFMPIAASGSGKSTFFKNYHLDGQLIHSMDLLRLEWYGDDPEQAFQAACKDKTFESKVKESFKELLKEGKTIFVDNTNLGKKRRAFYITEARRAGFFIIGILMPVSLDEILDRQGLRGDKSIPKDAVIRHYNTLQMPHLGAEMDSLIVCEDNLLYT